MNFKSIVVLESDWELNRPESYSVWPFISELSKVYEVASYYKGFSDGRSFAHWVRMFNASDVPKPILLYVAAHGKGNRLIGIDRAIEFDVIRQLISECPSLTQIYFACCLIGSDSNLSKLLQSASHVKWAVGFGVSVNWIDSLAFDLLFLSNMAKRQYERKGKHVHNVVQDLLETCPKLASTLGFRFKFRQGSLIKEVNMNTDRKEK